MRPCAPKGPGHYSNRDIIPRKCRASFGSACVNKFSCQNMSKSNNLAKESPEFIDLEIVASESGKPYVEIEMPRNSWVHVLHWCLMHRTPPYKFEFDALPAAFLRRSVTT